MIDTKKMYLCLLNGEMRHTSMLAGTHFDGCEYAHYECAILQLCDEVDRLRAENNDLKDALEYYANKNIWRKIETRTEYNTHIEYVWDWTRPPFERAQEVLDKFAEEL